MAMPPLYHLLSRKSGRSKTDNYRRDLTPALEGYSIEVMPRTAAKIDNFRALLPSGTRVYVAHIEGTPIHEMTDTVRRISEDGFAVMPHIPARLLDDEAMLEDWLSRYSDAGAREALVLAGGLDQPRGKFHCSMQLLETGLFDKHGFTRLHVAGHPEGNKDIDPDGSDHSVMEALRWKQAFNDRTDSEMAIVTQFAFEVGPVIEWTARLSAENVDLPIHLGIAGPAKLQTMIKFAVACGVGPSIRVLQRRAKDISNLLLPYKPTDVLSELLAHRLKVPDSNLRQVHFFPLGGIRQTVEFALATGKQKEADRPGVSG
ncbi:MAG: methylenetetrahydrofolate reductase [Sedimentitalea sp.]|uniref:methylenetetrahydrofolate reductase n=1 Tax=Sedimentitalea sp. TaxID=2048915 RepID=UPI003263E06D